ncbi:MAG: hypothetical protein IRZ05_13185 [Micromonosporaceae bacterium]|jgi:hypothetical protein|nr:hypothetical protein [Micromonosporaceae bacterium]
MELDTTTATRRRVVFDPSPMVGLLDAPVRYDLGESTCPALRVDEIGWGTDLATLDLGYGSLLGRTSLRTRIAVAPGSWLGEDDRVFRLGFGHLGVDDFVEALDRPGASIAQVRGS